MPWRRRRAKGSPSPRGVDRAGTRCRTRQPDERRDERAAAGELGGRARVARRAAAVRAIARACLVDTLGVAVGGAARGWRRLAREHVVASCARGPATVIGAEGGFARERRRARQRDARARPRFRRQLLRRGGARLGGGGARRARDRRVRRGAPARTCSPDSSPASRSSTRSGPRCRRASTTRAGGPPACSARSARPPARRRVLRLSAAQTTHAIGLAAAGTGGMRACLGTDAKPMLAGRAAEAGVVAAHYAARGATGPAGVFEDPRGLAALCNGGRFDRDALVDARRVVAAANARHRRQEVPGVPVGPRRRRRRARPDARARSAARRRRERDLHRAPGRRRQPHLRRPRHGQQAQFSLPFAVACMMVHGDITLDHLRAAAFSDPALVPGDAQGRDGRRRQLAGCGSPLTRR